MAALELDRSSWTDESLDEIPEDRRYGNVLRVAYGQEFREELIPLTVPDEINSLPNPRPNRLFGYCAQNVPYLRTKFGNEHYNMLPSMSASTVCFPYLTIEAKGHLGQLPVAENQSFVSARISLDITWPALRTRDMVFAVGTLPFFASVWVMWRDIKIVMDSSGAEVEQGYYCCRLLSTFDLLRQETFEEFRTLIHRIQRWAENERLPRIIEGLQKWEADGFPEIRH
ncbi:hypothetical protein F5Y11DRAFT_192531 [Daldinia sp. FL1419]|nr:hypothetical protein F5Y11DRAFT_192531 [Daldinia sp. FL1419]